MMNKIIQHEINIIQYLQSNISYSYIKPLISFNKYSTSKKCILSFTGLFILFDIKLFTKLSIGLFLSRTSNHYIKYYFKADRPYNKYPNKIKFYKKKKKLSYSFPSQSIQNITIIYYICNPANYIFIYYYWYLIIMIGLTRMFRGLHYLHDIIFSYFLCYYLAVGINIIL